MKLADRDDLPQVGDWITLSEAASLLRLSRQNVHVMAQNNKFITLAKLGEALPVYVVERSEALQIRKDMDEARATKNLVAKS